MRGPHALGRSEHLRRTADYERVYAGRAAASDEWLLIHAAANGLEFSRFGRSVGRKWGSAVTRNRLRRLLLEAFRLSKNELPRGYDFVAAPRRLAGLSLEQLRKSMVTLTRSAARRWRPPP